MLLLHSARRFTSLNITLVRRLVSPSASARKMNGDLNNASAARPALAFDTIPAYHGRSFAIPSTEDDTHVRATYRQFLPSQTAVFKNQIDWIPLSTGSVPPKATPSQSPKSAAAHKVSTA